MAAHRLEIDSACFSVANRRILQNVYLRVDSGEAVAIIGLNGSGKTSLMRLIYGTLRGDYKCVRVDEAWIDKAFRQPRTVRYCPQFNFIPQFLTVRRVFEDYNVKLSCFRDHFPQFEKYADYKLSRLSGGEVRLVEVYLTVMSDTKFCLLDEPFSQLMPLHVARIKEIIKEEMRLGRKGFLVTDHMYRDTLSIADRLYYLSNTTMAEIPSVDKLADLGYPVF